MTVIAAGPGRRRRLGPFQKVMTWIGSAVLVLATLAAGQWIDSNALGNESSHGPFYVAGKANEDVDLRTFTARVLGARYTTGVKKPVGVHTTSGVWVVVKVRFLAKGEPESLGYAALHTAAGKTYRATDRFTQELVGGRTFQPGIPVEGEIAFEVPANALKGMTIRFSSRGDLRLEAVSEIELPGATDAAVSKDPATLAPVEVKP